MCKINFSTALCLGALVLHLVAFANSWVGDTDVMEKLAEYKKRYQLHRNADKKYPKLKEIKYAEIKPYSDLTIPDIWPMYDDSVKSFLYKYYVDKNLEAYKKYLFEQVIDEWFLHVPCYTMKNIGEGASLKCPPDDPDLGKGNFAIPFKGSACVTDKYGCSITYNQEYKMYIISIDDLRRCGPGKIHAFVARTLGARSPIQEPDRNEHVTVNFENVELGIRPSFFKDDSWRKRFPAKMEDLDHCRKTSEEVYQMKTATFPSGIFDYGSVLVPETFQYSDPLDPRPVTVAKEIYEQVELDRSKYGHDFRLALTGNDLYRMRLFFTCGANSKCYKKGGVCKNMGFIASSPLIDLAKKVDQGVSCECFCPYSDLKGQFCEVNAFMKFKYLDTKAMCFKFIKKSGTTDVAKERGELETERGRNVLAPGAKSSYIYTKKDIFSDMEANALTRDQDALVALFHPSAEIKKLGGLAAAPDVWISKQWCTFIWAPPARKRAVVTVDSSRLWKAEEFTQALPEVTKSLIEKRGDCQRALKFVHSHGPDPAKLRVKCFSVIYYSPERPYTIWSNTSALTAYVYWDWYLSQGIARQLKHAMKLTLVTRFEKAPAQTLGLKPAGAPPKLVERPDPPSVKGTTEAWMNPNYPMQDWFATVKTSNSKKIALFVVGLILTLGMLGGGAYLFYYFAYIKPNLDDDEGYEKIETAYNTPGEVATPAGGSNEGLKLD